MAEWNHRMCGDCWIDRHPFEQYEDGSTYWRPPVQFKSPPGTCCFCGNKTVLGIYVRHDPKKLKCKHEESE